MVMYADDSFLEMQYEDQNGFPDTLDYGGNRHHVSGYIGDYEDRVTFVNSGDADHLNYDDESSDWDDQWFDIDSPWDEFD